MSKIFLSATRRLCNCQVASRDRWFRPACIYCYEMKSKTAGFGLAVVLEDPSVLALRRLLLLVDPVSSQKTIGFSPGIFYLRQLLVLACLMSQKAVGLSVVLEDLFIGLFRRLLFLNLAYLWYQKTARSSCCLKRLHVLAYEETETLTSRTFVES